MPLNPKRLPPALIALIPMAEKWGIGDDYEREAMVKAACTGELIELVHCIDDVSDEDLDWLGGEESYNPHPSQAYLAITNLIMAIESAKVKLKKREGRP